MNRQVESSLEGNESGGVSSTNTGPSMLNGLVRYRELSKIVANHFRLDFNLIEGLAIVNTNDAPNHFGNNDHVPKVSSHWLRLLTGWCLPFLLQVTKKPA